MVRALGPIMLRRYCSKCKIKIWMNTRWGTTLEVSRSLHCTGTASTEASTLEHGSVAHNNDVLELPPPQVFPAPRYKLSRDTDIPLFTSCAVCLGPVPTSPSSCWNLNTVFFRETPGIHNVLALSRSTPAERGFSLAVNSTFDEVADADL